MYNKIITTVFLSHFFWLSAFAQCTSYWGGIHCVNINSGNIDNAMPVIEEYLNKGGGYFGFGNEADINAALNNIEVRMNQLFDSMNMIHLDAGILEKTGHETINNYKLVDLRWSNPIPDATYFSGYMNLLTNEKFDNPINEIPGNRFSVPETTTGYLFTLNARLNGAQGSFDIIIVDRDINFTGLNPPLGFHLGNNSGNNNSSPNSIQSSTHSLNQINLFPNPFKDSNFNIDFHLSENQNTSIQLFQASSGKLVKTILTQQFLEKGNHSIIVENEKLMAGLYFIVLQTDNEKKVEKLIKID